MRALALAGLVLLLNLAACAAAPLAQAPAAAGLPAQPAATLPEPGEVSPRRVH
jgi:hypothetical protein